MNSNSTLLHSVTHSVWVRVDLVVRLNKRKGGRGGGGVMISRCK